MSSLALAWSSQTAWFWPGLVGLYLAKFCLVLCLLSLAVGCSLQSCCRIIGHGLLWGLQWQLSAVWVQFASRWVLLLVFLALVFLHLLLWPKLGRKFWKRKVCRRICVRRLQALTGMPMCFEAASTMLPILTSTHKSCLLRVPRPLLQKKIGPFTLQLALCVGSGRSQWLPISLLRLWLLAFRPRHMTPSEAEEVDKEVLSEVFHLVYHEGNTLDAALEALVREDLLRIKMVSVPSSLPLSRPRLLRLETGPPSSVARAKSKDCFAWKNTGSCKFGDGCKFARPKPSEWLGPDEVQSPELQVQKEDLIHGVQPSLQGCNAVDTHAPQLDAPACAMPSYGSFQPPLCVDCNILDGGGLGSSADWFVPRVSEDLFLQLRHKFQSWALEWRVVDRLRKHVAAKCSDCLFTKAEIHLLQAGLVEFLNSRGHTCNSCVEPHQPFLLSAWRALTEFVQDIDGSLPNVFEWGCTDWYCRANPSIRRLGAVGGAYQCCRWTRFGCTWPALEISSIWSCFGADTFKKGHWCWAFSALAGRGKCCSAWLLVSLVLWRHLAKNPGWSVMGPFLGQMVVHASCKNSPAKPR